MLTHMKTTLELPDDLLIEAKTMAVRRRTTLRALIEHALRRELQPANPVSEDAQSFIEMDPNDLPRLKSRGVRVTSEAVYQMLDEEGF